MSTSRHIYGDAVAQSVQDAISRGRRTAEQEPRYFYGKPTHHVTGNYRAWYGQHILCAPDVNGSVIELPKIEPKHIGLPITVTKIAARGRVMIKPAQGGYINDMEEFLVTQSFDSVVLVATMPGLWQIGTSISAVPAASELWKWNQRDMSQFDSVVLGSQLTSASAAVVTAYGRKWIELTVTNGAGAPHRWNRGAILPINWVPTAADYKIAYNWVYRSVSTGTTDNPCVAPAFRWTDTSSSGDYYTIAQESTSLYFQHIVGGAASGGTTFYTGTLVNPHEIGTAGQMVGYRVEAGIFGATRLSMNHPVYQHVFDSAGSIADANQAGLMFAGYGGSYTNKYLISELKILGYN